MQRTKTLELELHIIRNLSLRTSRLQNILTKLSADMETSTSANFLTFTYSCYNTNFGRITTNKLRALLAQRFHHSGQCTEFSKKTLHKLECRGQTPKGQCLNSVVVWWRSKSHIKEELHLLRVYRSSKECHLIVLAISGI